jgi:miniconductance mechanosensitive channel
MKKWLVVLENEYVLEVLILCGLLVIALIGYYLSKKFILPLIHRFFSRTKIKWDDLLTDHKVLSRLMLLIPAVILHYGLPLTPHLFKFVSKSIQLYIYIVIIVILNSLLDALVAIYNSHPISDKWPVKGWGQLLKIFISILGGIFIIALILGKSPWGMVSSIGAMTAVLMLIFKDTLLCFVASLQIASYNLIRVGDWIEMPAFSADGDVIDISLHTVRVQNFDKTIVSIPTHKFLDHSFRNWRGMYQAGGRRIKRSILIDQSSVKFLDAQLLETLSRADLLKGYLADKQKQIKQYNQTTAASADSPLNGRRLTNLGTFRAYILEYLKHNPHVRKDLTLMARHLQPEADKGIPLEIYCFVDDTRWPVYEGIQADIFDHILAALPFFGLRTYQRDALVDGRI